MRITEEGLAMLRILEPYGARPMEIVVHEDRARRRLGRAHINHYPPLADRMVIRAHYGTVKHLIRHRLVSLHHTDHTGDHHLRINERGKAAIRQGHGLGLEARCPDCFHLIAPSFPLHDCIKKRNEEEQ